MRNYGICTMVQVWTVEKIRFFWKTTEKKISTVFSKKSIFLFSPFSKISKDSIIVYMDWERGS